MFRKMFISFALMFVVTGAYSAYAQEAPQAQQQPALQQKAPDANISDRSWRASSKRLSRLKNYRKSQRAKWLRPFRMKGSSRAASWR